MGEKVTIKDYNDNTIRSQWCPGCGDFAVIKSLKDALVGLQIEPHNVAVVAGIGCAGRAFAYLNGYSFHGVHGRALPTATGLKLANQDLTVLVLGGDGDGYAIGMGHFPHTIRRNVDIVYLVMNNQTYGLTKGQASPTSDFNFRTVTTPEGNIEGAINPMAIALSSGITFLARVNAGDPKHMAMIIEKAIAHKGFALVDIFSPCVTYNKVNTYDWYKENSYYLEEEDGYDPSNFEMAVQKVFPKEKLPLGVIYQREKPTYEELRPGSSRVPIVHEPLYGIDYSKILQEFM
ncbi:MAG: 2-oxoacid:ferredoxin oxidoreductase subunit beta [Candidatus Tectomicrobia bacterium]|nr:2-oxoacid:ferredoxin oxidoreductase subunit beta [Candidatus Tectomicrobia bacterium]